MAYLYLDVETLPTTDAVVIAELEDEIKPPGSMSKAETIEAWRVNTKPQAVADAVAKTSFSGAYGSLCCVSFALDDGMICTEVRGETGGESALLQTVLKQIEILKGTMYGPLTIVGHNVAFDIRFIWQRAFILGVRLPNWFPRDPKPWSREVHDTMMMWDNKNYISLDKLCRAMGIKGVDGITGAGVAEAWKHGEFDKILSHCRDDVDRVRKVHKRMMVAIGD